MTTEPKQVSGTDIYLYDQAKWDRRTVADGDWLQNNTLNQISANDRILASAITDTSGILQEEIIYLGDNIGNLSGDLYNTSSYLNEEIDKINARSDVTDVVGSYSDFLQLSAEVIAGTYDISDGDIIKILNDETRNHGQTYYRFSANAPETSAWTYIGYLEPHFHNAIWSANLNNDNRLDIKNTSKERSFELGAIGYIELNRRLDPYNDNEYEYYFKLNDGFVNSASKVYETLSSISAINDGTLTGPKVNHKVSDYSLAQGSANSAVLYSFAQGLGNLAESQSIAVGKYNIASGTSQALGLSNSAEIISFAAGYKSFADDISFAQGSANAASNGSITQGSDNNASNNSQAFGKGLLITNSGMAIGSYNKLSADMSFVIGNGTDDEHRSDLYWINHHGDVYTDGTVSAVNFYINGNPIDSLVSAKFSAYDGTTKIGEFPISSFSLKANTAKYISATVAENMMIFNVSDALINSASSGYQASAWIAANSTDLINSAKSGAAASAWITANSTRITNIENSAMSGAAASAWITANSTDLINSAKSGAEASAWITANSTRITNIENSAKSGYQASAWISANSARITNIENSAKSGAEASAWITANSTRITNIENSAMSGAAASAWITANSTDLINSAKSGAAASAYITAKSGDFLNSAHNAYGTLTFNTKAYNANTSSYGLTISAGQGISFITGSDKVTISAEGTTYSNGTYISTANKTISVTGSLITSANAGSAASAWVNNTLFDYYWKSGAVADTASGKIDQIKVCYKNDVNTPSIMHNQEVIFKNGTDVISGLLIQAATNNDNGNVLTYNSTDNSYTWEAIAFTNTDHNIDINNGSKTINLPSSGLSINSAYSAQYIGTGGTYNTELNGEHLNFHYGNGNLKLSFTGIQTNNLTANWDNMFGNFAEVTRDNTIKTDLKNDRVNIIINTGSSGSNPYKQLNFVVTSTLPSVLSDNTYYIV